MTKDKQESTLEPSLRAVWNRTQRKRFFAGLLALCRWAIPLFLAGMTLDWLAYLPTPGRLAVLIVRLLLLVSGMASRLALSPGL